LFIRLVGLKLARVLNITAPPPGLRWLDRLLKFHSAVSFFCALQIYLQLTNQPNHPNQKGTAIGVYGTITAKDKASVAPESLYSIDGGLPVRFRASQTSRPQYSQRFFKSQLLPEMDHVLTILNAGVGADPFFLDFVMVQSNEDAPPASSLTASLSSSNSMPLTSTAAPPPVTVTITSVQATSTPPSGVANDVKATAVAVSGASQSNGGAAAGGIIAGVVVLFLAVFGFIMWRRKRGRRRSLLSESSSSGTGKRILFLGNVHELLTTFSSNYLPPVRARPEADTVPASKVQLNTPLPLAAPDMSQHSGGQYSGNHYPGGYISSNSYNNYQQQQQQQQQQQYQQPQHQQPQYRRQQPAHSTYDYSSSGKHEAYGGIAESRQPSPQLAYLLPSQAIAVAERPV
jgi:hypothetical protein